MIISYINWISFYYIYDVFNNTFGCLTIPNNFMKLNS